MKPPEIIYCKQHNTQGHLQPGDLNALDAEQIFFCFHSPLPVHTIILCYIIMYLDMLHIFLLLSGDSALYD